MSATATPAMRQYLDAKQQHRDAILLFRMGDFFEMFYEDALVGARALELTLTSRSKDTGGGGIPMCGVPHHAVDSYLDAREPAFLMAVSSAPGKATIGVALLDLSTGEFTTAEYSGTDGVQALA